MATKESHATERAPGRPRLFDPEGALAAALELFWSQGYRTTTTRDLEKALGMSQSSIYNAFGSKQDLLEATLDLYELLADEELVQPLVNAKEGVEAIDKFLLAHYHWVTQPGKRGCLVSNMMAEDGGTTDMITKRSREYRRQIRTTIRMALKRAAKTGELTDVSLDDRADLLLGMLLGLNIASRGGASYTELGRMLDAARGQLDAWRSTPS